MKPFAIILAVAITVGHFGPAFAEQTAIKNYNSARTVFWRDLYPNDGTTHSDIYCGFEFRSRDDVEMQIEHVYPASWMGDFLNCGTRKQCRATSTTFNHMEADLHNLYPSEASANQLRSNHPFEIIPGEDWAFEDCDMEIADVPGGKIIEAREIARGNLARAIFYMHVEYGLPLASELGALLKQWNIADPPSRDERRRNTIIEDIQGERNLFIDDPSRADPLNF